VSELKIVVGMGSLDDYEEYVNAGADELFIGYVPFEYVENFKSAGPLNRREVKYVNVQIGSESELLILKKMMEVRKVPVSIAINGLYYESRQYRFMENMVRHLIQIGFDHFIVADYELIKRLSEIDGIHITVSGELGEMNSLVLDLLESKSITRVIFPRQTGIDEMKSALQGRNIEAEAFALNEKCHFTGAYCNSIHCDELCHMCKIPYRLNGMAVEFEDTEVYVPGLTGCAICSLYEMREAGITHIKLVSRGEDSESTVRDIEILKQALDLLGRSDSEKEYKNRIFTDIFADGCSRNCYGKAKS